MATVELKNVSKSFGPVRVIESVNLTIGDGEFVVFVGASGSGKSTLLRMVAGLEQVSGGDVLIDGKDVTFAEPAERGIAMVFQSYALYPHMNVYDNIAFNLRLAKFSRDEIDKRVKEAARILRLNELLSRSPAQLSGGQRQRVAIGRAIVRKPEVFLFDEPLSNLDAELRVQMRLELAKLHRSLGATMIYVTHDQTEAMTLADRIVVLRDGVIEQFGTPAQIYDAPSNRFVAGFMGSPKMSFLEASVEKQEGTRLTLQIAGTTDGSVELNLVRSMTLSGSLTVGIRPEHFSTHRTAGPRLQADVEFVERLGGESFLHAPAHPAGVLVMRQSGEEARSVGLGKSEIGVDWRKAHLFAPDGTTIPLKREL